MSLRSLHLASLALIASTALAQATDRYVSTTGSNANAGTIGAPLLTINAAITASSAGDTIYVRGGIYASERVLFSGKNGTAGAPITLRNYPGETAIIDRTGVAPPNNIDAGLLEITNSNYITVQGLEIRNFATSSATRVPIGIFVYGSGTGIRLISNKVHDIQQTNADGGNGFGIAVKGTSATAIDQIVIDGNEVYNLKTGFSESVTLNGNVTNMTVTNNVIHDCNNIGIDFIGYEGTNATASLDRARIGVCSGNTVYNIDSLTNPAYGGRAAPGIYVDGGQSVTIERNLVHHCNYGISAGSEHAGKFSDSVIIRNNVIRQCHVGGIVLGGAVSGTNGGATNITISNNTLYKNDTDFAGGGCVEIQNNVSTTTIKNNIMVASADGTGWGQFVLKTNTNGSFAANSINWNLYSGTTASDNLEFIWTNPNSPLGSFAAWRTASSQDTNSTFTTASLGFTNAAANDFTLLSTSIARDTGDTAFVAGSGEKDFGGQSRVANSRVDIGMDEYMTAWQSWRDQYFSLPDGGTGANAADDYDRDGSKNLIEYSQGANPTISDTALLPAATRNGNSLRFTYRKSVSDVTYAVDTSPNLTSWTATAVTEQTDGAGLFWRDFTITGGLLFVRLRVVLP